MKDEVPIFPELPDIIGPNLRILFIGYNPSLHSARTGHHFAFAGNRFWRVLYLAGLTTRQLSSEEDGTLPEMGLGITNIVARPTKNAAEISRSEFKAGRLILQKKLLEYKPQIACYVGAGVYEAFTGRSKVSWGFCEENFLPGIRDFAAPNTSGLVRMSLDELADIYRGLSISQ